MKRLTTRACLAAALWAATALAHAQTIKLTTSEGDIRIELDAAAAPKTVANFVQYVKSGHYVGTVFHRVIPGFMIQGGGFDAKLNQKPTKPPIPLESGNGLLNARGTIAMARTNDPNSATSQFFINVVDNAFLDKSEEKAGYAVFGKVVDGMEVVDKIAATPTTANGMHQNLPATAITITKAIVETKK